MAVTTAAETSARTGTPTGAPGRRRVAVGLVVLLVAVAGSLLLSLSVGSRALDVGTVWRVLFAPDGSDAAVIVHDLRLPRTVLGLLVGIALGIGRRADAGPHPQPAGRPRAARRHERRGVRRGHRHLRAQRRPTSAATSGSRFAGAPIASVVVFAIGAAGGRGPTPVTLALAGTAVVGAARVVHLGARPRATSRRWTSTGSGWSARSPGATSAVAVQVAAVHRWSAWCSPSPTRRRSTCSRLGDDVARALGQHVAAHPGHRAVARSRCSPAPPPRRAGRSPSSA